MGAIDVLTASAGTGKTYRLVQEAQRTLDAGTPPERLMAVTFTVRAADELLERLRSHLLEQGCNRQAERLLGARIGTVHAVFGALLREFALEAGRSPLAEVLPEDVASRFFAEAAAIPITHHAPAMNALASRLGFRSRRPPLQWSDQVRRIADAARQNGIAPEALGQSAARSWDGLRALLPPSDPRGAETLDRELIGAIGAALAAISASDTTQGTSKAVETMRRAISTLRHSPGELPWADWVRLSKLGPGKASREVVAPVIAAASRHPSHPRLASDLRGFIDMLFACAAEAMSAFCNWKTAQGVVDFTDQEAESLLLLQSPEVCAILRERVDRVLVDEFQDTNPLQLALFVRMAAIVQRSTWVGDPKQAIYGFRGSDPEMMGEVVGRIVAASGGTVEPIDTSRRSRPGLVSFFDDLFVPAFARLGLTSVQVALGQAARRDTPGQPTPLGVLPLQAKNAAEEAAALAAGIRSILLQPEAWAVQPNGQEAARPLRPGDVAVLCRRNDRCAAVATALEELGIRAAIGRPGLFDSAEVVISHAALRWAVDPRDRLALAELSALTAGDDAGWLEAALDDDADVLEAHVPVTSQLAGLRNRLLHLTPAEALDAAVAASDVERLVHSLGDAEARLANLEALRGLAVAYEELCKKTGAPATAAGLCSWLSEQDGAKLPANPDPDAVQILTCHGSKGLEWPLVVLSDLGEPPDARLFDQPVAEPPDGQLDWHDPLAGRWIRFWPWPYDPNHTGVGLDVTGPASIAGKRAHARAEAESIRLLYVAMTRARDYLVLAPRLGKDGWLDRLTDANGLPLVQLPDAPDAPILVGGHEHVARLVQLAAGDHAHLQVVRGHLTQGPGGLQPVHPSLRLRPSGMAGTGEEAQYDVIRLGDRLPLIGDPDMTMLGEAVHGFLAADDRQDEPDRRATAAAMFLERWGVVGALPPSAMVTAADRLWAWLHTEWPDAVVDREVPLHGRLGLQRVSGRIDLLAYTSLGPVLLDHKTFPGGSETWPKRVQDIAPQLATYSAICGQAGHAIQARVIHLPISGVLLQLK